eukprot:TRINITY_DN16049_c0_g1_i1.p1 TRINITY_DN16049_c0_g1~~TRINITY_DN16049_c0_g1_i1.p1  ORF type:complete len:382 (+),score=97.77 TRINITY_DN16049_c0_g1_i1:46-1146(+)
MLRALAMAATGDSSVKVEPVETENPPAPEANSHSLVNTLVAIEQKILKSASAVEDAIEEDVVHPIKDGLKKAMERCGRLKQRANEEKSRAKTRHGQGSAVLQWLHMKSDEEQLEERDGHLTWKTKVVHFVHSNRVQTLFTLLLALDILIVYAEVFVDAHYPLCLQITRDSVSCCPAPDGADAHHRLLGGGGGDGHAALCAAGLVETTHPTGCDAHKYPAIHSLHVGLTLGSVIILSVFEIELLALMVILKGIFFRNLLYVLDWVVVTTSLILDLAILSGAVSSAQIVATLIIIVRIWRLMRITHGVALTVHERDHHVIEEISEVAHELEDELGDLEKKLEETEAKLQRTKKKLKDAREANGNAKPE